MLYFGYGSNLDQGDLASWCARNGYEYPLGTCRGLAHLPDHKLAFTRFATTRNGGVLDVVEYVGAISPGVLFEVEPSSLRILDAKEGAPGAYRRKPCVVLLEEGTELPALTYEVGTKAHHQVPSEAYLEVVIRGYRAHGIELQFLKLASKGEVQAISTVFVYGTLKQGFYNHGLLENKTTFLCSGKTKGVLYDLGPYPGMILRNGNDLVHGELYLMHDPVQLLPQLDALEGMTGFGKLGRLFRRALAAVQSDRGNMVAWTYVVEDPSRGRLMESGEWSKRASLLR